MSRDSMYPYLEAPWGQYRLSGFAQICQKISQRMPVNWVGRRGALLFRRLALIGVGSVIDVEAEGLRLRVATTGNVSDRKFAFMPQFVDAFERREIMAQLKPGGYFLDIGANAGIYSLCAAREYQKIGGGRVFAFEPNPEVLPLIRRNVVLNDMFDCVEVVAEALGDYEGTMAFVIDESNLGQSGIDTGQLGRRIEVPCGTLMSFISGRGLTAPDALKIDVEGAEDRVLGGFMKDAPTEILPRLLVIENSEKYWSLDLADIFKRRGYLLTERRRMNSVFTLKK